MAAGSRDSASEGDKGAEGDKGSAGVVGGRTNANRLNVRRGARVTVAEGVSILTQCGKVDTVVCQG